MIPVKELKRVRDAYIEKYLNPVLAAKGKIEQVGQGA
jgi:V/A-type H+-transporting ATPase subunit B